MPIKSMGSSALSTTAKAQAKTAREASAPAKPDAQDTNKAAASDKEKPINNLGDYLQSTGKEAADLLTDTWKINSAARALLKSKGIINPTDSQLTTVVAEISQAINAGQWQSFSPSIKANMVKLADGINQRLGNIFGEKKVFSEFDLKTENLKLAPSEQRRLMGDYESGRSGMIMAASFINTSSRSEGDFSHAYGDKSWRGFMRAHNYLDAIPRGEFIDKLDLDLICKTNELAMSPDKGIKAWMLSAIAAVGRGGHWARAGKIREGRQFARPQSYTEDQLKNMEQAGVDVMRLYSDDDGSYAMLEYPKPELIKTRLNEIIQTLRESLGKEDADPIDAAAQFQRSFVALHPFGDSNGRSSRLLMNRILAEFALPPAILDRQNHDVDLSPTQWRREVAEGVARSKDFLRSSNRMRSKDNFLAHMGIFAVEQSPDNPISIDGNSFDLGRDGLLYDPMGRPWMAVKNELVPLSQMDHFVLSRRILMMGKEAGTSKLKAISKNTRALYRKISKNPEEADNITVRADFNAREADEKYQLKPEPELAKLLTELADISKIDPAQIFSVKRAQGTDISSTISKYSQIDLEFWYLQRGLEDSGQDALAMQVLSQRAKLFSKAKEHLAAVGEKSRKTEKNPLGFRFKFEKLMYDQSPLRFASLDDAIQKEGDDSINVWRGDYGFAKLIGMAPNNDVRQPDAKAIAKQRAEKGQLTNLFDDLTKLEGSAIGRQYICATSDLALLKDFFANKTSSEIVSLGELPDFISDHILAWIDPEKDAAKNAEAKASSDSQDPGSKVIKDKFGVPGTLFSLKIKEKDSKKIEVEANRKAFLMRMDKDAMLPGIVALGGAGFESEQEMHGLERVYPWNIKGAWEAKSLGEPWPAIEAKTEASDDKSKNTDDA